MSNSTNSQISHNLYFEGKVQSLGLETANGKATVGVMKKGTYTFSASSTEKMVIISGSMDVKLTADGEFKKYAEQEEFDVAGGTSFEVSCNDDVAYLCYYG
ncbi:MAG: pyrimidine/purine nucleoside phosphorylase [Candidatus Pedobacter colombiensis]|uniref:Pyrimidine/purine nucleoside phosphorylase n=1 Tax=Candidatus Pedobacter colombiensis TaxID=3121371 RepID=A0AAJ6B706_9SPHI|nr:pyrimidine/purine nucleoside phosphorylase [Pedobacter sp.]WEK17568.1 MAG: pyrimidine/purine nucleoside phosphorylase [Pedobacter sp.]